VLGFCSPRNPRLAGKADRTATDYTKALTDLQTQHLEPMLSDMKAWIASTISMVARRNTLRFVKSDIQQLYELSHFYGNDAWVSGIQSSTITLTKKRQGSASSKRNDSCINMDSGVLTNFD